MKELSVIVLDLARLGLNGDADSVRAYVRRLLATLKDDSPREVQLRDALTKLIVKQQSAIGARSTAATRTSRHAVPVDPSTFQALARIEEPVAVSAPILAPSIAETISRIIEEHSRVEVLARAGVEPTRSILLTGAPGTGKTMTARYVAASLGKSLITVDLATVMSSLLGKTGQNLRDALAFARSTESVLLLDEFDALGKRRDDPTDVGELKRIVNVLLLEIERWHADSLLIAATNHPELLDRAVWRRFDTVIEFEHPDVTERRDMISQLLAFYAAAQLTDSAIDTLAGITRGFSGSDLSRTVREASRMVALNREETFARAIYGIVLGRLLKDAKKDEAARDAYIRIAHDVLGHSYRKIADVLGVSHVTAWRTINSGDDASGAQET